MGRLTQLHGIGTRTPYDLSGALSPQLMSYDLTSYGSQGSVGNVHFLPRVFRWTGSGICTRVG